MCDEGMAAPCLNGLSVWIWIVLITGFALLCCGALLCMALNAQRGNTPCEILRFAEAVFTASHSVPSNSRLYGRGAPSDWPCLDLVEAQNCCCCLPIGLGLLLLGLVDMARLGVSFAYGLDSIIVYSQTAPGEMYAGMMEQGLRSNVEAYLWPCMVVSGLKLLNWLLVVLSSCCELETPIRALLWLLPVDLGFSIVFANYNAMYAQQLCITDVQVYAASGHIGVRRNYLAELPPPPLHVDTNGIPEVCHHFWRQETAVAASDCVACAVLAVCIAYMSWSRLRAWDRESGPIKNSAFGPPIRV